MVFELYNSVSTLGNAGTIYQTHMLLNEELPRKGQPPSSGRCYEEDKLYEDKIRCNPCMFSVSKTQTRRIKP